MDTISVIGKIEHIKESTCEWRMGSLISFVRLPLAMKRWRHDGRAGERDQGLRLEYSSLVVLSARWLLSSDIRIASVPLARPPACLA